MVDKKENLRCVEKDNERKSIHFTIRKKKEKKKRGKMSVHTHAIYGRNSHNKLQYLLLVSLTYSNKKNTMLKSTTEIKIKQKTNDCDNK